MKQDELKRIIEDVVTELIAEKIEAMFDEKMEKLLSKSRKDWILEVSNVLKAEKLSDKLLKKEIEKTLDELEMPKKYLGYEYTKIAIFHCLKDKTMLHKTTTSLYPIIAKEFNTATYNIERGIRKVKEKTFEKGNKEKILEVFGSNEIPKNVNFIYQLICYIQN